MLIPVSVVRDLDEMLNRQATPWRVSSVPVHVDPLQFVRAGSHLVSDAAYFGRPGAVEIGGLGTAWRTVAPFGQERFDELQRAVPALGPEVIVHVGFSFRDEGPSSALWDGFYASQALVPSAAVVAGQGGNRLVVVVPPGRSHQDTLSLLESLHSVAPPLPPLATAHAVESIPSPAAWVEAVEEVVAEIQQDDLEKVVLARSVVVSADVASRPFDVTSRLRDGYPECLTYAWQADDSAFVGSSPELLIGLSGSRFYAEPFAGSSRRGESDEHDRALGEALMASRKNRIEHRLVVDDIAARLAPLATDMNIPSTPKLRKMANVQHLATPIDGAVADEVSILHLASLLHPTPAIGGVPRDAALRLIAKLESIDRGWYSGGVGWMNGDGDGEIALALRCALLHGSNATLFAGAGIVAESDAQAELEETRLKFQPVLSLLTQA